VERLRRIAAVLIALSLVLPERSCVNDGRTEISYPLSGADSALSIALIAALYLLPLAVLLVPRFRIANLVAGIAAAATGLYFFSYGSWMVASKLLLGWYTRGGPGFSDSRISDVLL